MRSLNSAPLVPKAGSDERLRYSRICQTLRRLIRLRDNGKHYINSQLLPTNMFKSINVRHADTTALYRCITIGCSSLPLSGCRHSPTNDNPPTPPHGTPTIHPINVMSKVASAACFHQANNKLHTTGPQQCAMGAALPIPAIQATARNATNVGQLHLRCCPTLTAMANTNARAAAHMTTPYHTVQLLGTDGSRLLAKMANVLADLIKHGYQHTGMPACVDLICCVSASQAHVWHNSVWGPNHVVANSASQQPSAAPASSAYMRHVTAMLS
jgi:hypothetical protein